MIFQRYLTLPLVQVVVVATTIICLSTRSEAETTADMCKETDYPGVCSTALQDVKTGGGFEDATSVAIQASIAQINQAKSKVLSLMKTETEEGKLFLDVCREVYQDALDNLTACDSDLKEKSRGGLEDKLSSALSDIGTCDDTLNETTNLASAPPVLKYNDVIEKLVTDALALASKI
ncbi:PREDICTED: putative pectinesterase/pectinesterase inhibitor 26 [Nelumbo nucifera]|uniref:Pectinesterase inhibitor domain-containing protein n=2 Tax=Nelumbo nucifera TaxID=4432 RepID=A0A822YTR0_NELNU|nr:PREDICTED: putative pectinesterase/pectinesterase inhibitor 26 [Nelumbo nucifera]DAD34505.1 TPA_asm: hypothetical protein HUJ06_005145 [Nelumbo nucifera]